jgi:hypothetical protein
MDILKPNTRYKLVTVTLACPESIGEAGMADGINEMLNEGISRFPDNCAYADWSIDFSGPVRTTSREAEEGELFDPVVRSAL